MQFPLPHRLVRRVLDWDLSPADALRLLRSDAHPVALLGGWTSGDVIGSEPVLVRSPPQPFASVMDSWSESGSLSATARAQGVRFGGGWIGYLGYGLASEFLQVPPAPSTPRRLPVWWLGYYDHVLRHDRASGRWIFEALWTPDRADALERRFDDLSRRLSSQPGEAVTYSCGGFLLTPSAAEHQAAVRRAIEFIRKGDIFQANICLRLEASFGGDPLDGFCRAVTRLRPPFAAFLRMSPTSAVASMSPELFLRRQGKAVLSRPVKGTHQRSAHRLEAARQRLELESSGKNRAENVMIVDLMRNDLSRVCTAGSVRVPRLAGTEAHPGVWHLVSDICGTLTPASGDGDLIRAAFPPGSVTGAPKTRVLEIIHELEATPREVYTGALGHRSYVAGLELNVAIRTFEFHEDRVWLGSGGGIVAGSADDDEFRECLLKASPLIRALGGHLSRGTARRSGPAPGGRSAIGPSWRPRPAAGVFTSLRVTKGTASGLADHMARLENSTRELFGKGLPAGLYDDLAARLSQSPSGRLRITARPLGGPLRCTVEVVPSGPPPTVLRLRPVIIPGGLGGHKWLDRRLLAELARSTSLAPDEQLLIEDASGEILETDRANVFAVIDGALHTPPADGRLLPGVTRSAVIRAAALDGVEIATTPLTRGQMAGASEIFVSNAVHGILPVRSIDTIATTWRAGPVAGRVASRLGRRAASHRLTAPRRMPARRLTGAAGSRGDRVRPVVVLVDNYDSFTYNLVHMLQSAGCRVEVVRNDEVPAAEIAAFGPAGVVLSPGPCGPEDAGISMDVVRLCSARQPVLGICLGHQAIAAAFGAKIIPAPRPVHGETALVVHDARGLLSGLPQNFAATRYHSLVVDESTLPPFLTVTARERDRIPMALRHAALPIEGVQFHPESILTTHGEIVIRNFVRCLNGQLPV